MNSKQIRQQFLDFFQGKTHKIVPSAPIVNKDDPTLMFTNAGMNQFKDLFLGNQVPANRRLADTQKCLRVSGKHNDLEEVGRDSYHHTMFEMLGNWSIGDYFKKEAIAWAWELLTEVYKIDKNRLYVSVFEGDEKEGLAPDNEAVEFWKAWIDEDRILYFDKKDNFWEMGETGPCGPCSEIHVDIRSDEERAKVDGKSLVNADHPLVIEVWNLVFIQFNRKADRSLEALPEKHIDTGMGFERLCMVVQGKTSNYDTDVFTPFIEFLEKESGKQYNFSYAPDAMSDIAMRVITDHLRAVSFVIADGQLPANTGAGYVIRRILRRAVRYYYSFLDVKEPLIYKMVPLLSGEFSDTFPELKAQQDLVAKVIKQEEISFLRTLASGIKRLDEIMMRATSKRFEEFLSKKGIFFEKEKNINDGELSNEKFDYYLQEERIGIILFDDELKSDTLYSEFNDDKVFKIGINVFREGRLNRVSNIFSKRNLFFLEGIELTGALEISGTDAFELYDTYGFPIDLTRLIAEEKGYTIDEAAFKKALAEQKERSRADAKKEVGDWVSLSEEEVNFVGYDQLKVEGAKVIKYRTVIVKKKEQYQIVLNTTPFYAESGGQAGDTGLLFFGEEKIAVIDTQKENDLTIHIVNKLPDALVGTGPQSIEANVAAAVNIGKRQATESNHSAVHLMHAALHQIIGTHALQKGQRVDNKKLSFDFSHFQKLSAAEVAKIEQLVNEKIRENIILEEVRHMPIEEAKESGAMMLFGEKYGDTVRVITFDQHFSRELCGGTHVDATGKIGLFKITSEGAVAAGIRRIEAVTADTAEAYVNKELEELNNIRSLFKNPLHTAKNVAALQDENKSLKKQIEQLVADQANALQDQLKGKVQQINGVNFIGVKLPLNDSNAIKTLAYQLEKEIGNALIVFGAEVKGKPQLQITISKNLVDEKSLNAGSMIRELAKEIKGGGGGQPFYASAGGSDVGGLESAIEKAKGMI